MRALIDAIRLPIAWERLGFPGTWRSRKTALIEGGPAWSWSPIMPDLPLASCLPIDADEVTRWGLDHVVVLAPVLDDAVAALRAAGADLRLRAEARGRPAAFFRVGPVLEVVEATVPTTLLYGIALVTSDPLEEVVDRWRRAGHDVSDPKPAVQPGRRIVTVRSAAAGLAVMSPEGSAPV